jgi:hypothetical protein
MCEPLETLRIEIIDSRNVENESAQPIIDAAFAADQATTCCLDRKNAITRAVFEKARDLGFEVAWGDVLDQGAPKFILWPNDTWRLDFIRNYLDEHHATRIYPKDLR